MERKPLIAAIMAAVVLGSAISGAALEPGIYVAARQLSGAATIGVHQYLVLVPQDPLGFTALKNLGDGTPGVVVGAHNIQRRLQVQWFHDADHQATREYVNPRVYVRRLRPAYRTELRPVRLADKQPIDATIAAIVESIKHYERHEQDRPIPYPTLKKQIAGTRDCLNSNAWAQSVIEYVVGNDAVDGDFRGLDRCHDSRIDTWYFRD